jgi:DNA recombination protein RmuC
MMQASEWLLVAVAVLVPLVLLRVYGRRRARAALTREMAAPVADPVSTEEVMARLEERFADLSSRALRENLDAVLDTAERRLVEQRVALDERVGSREVAIAGMLEPVTTALARVDGAVRLLEQDRKQTEGALGEQLSMVARSHEQLRSETGRLATALRAPHVRGRWGEMQLLRVVELAGMDEHCDFVEQESVQTADGKLRPDLIVNLPDGKRIVVDSKVPLQGLLEAIQAPDDEQRQARLAAHARHVRKHMTSLASKEYWSAVAGSPDFVVLFVAGESFMAHALHADPALMEDGFQRRVLLATPTTLMALLNTVAYSWRQVRAGESADEIVRLGRDLHDRLVTFTGHMEKVGKNLDGATGSYNSAVSSLERRVLVTARKLGVHGAANPRKLLVQPCPATPTLTGRRGSGPAEGNGQGDRSQPGSEGSDPGVAA